MPERPTYIVNGKRVDPNGKPVSEEVVSSTEATATGTNYNDLKVPELKTLAAERGIEGANDMQKAELVAALEAGDE